MVGWHHRLDGHELEPAPGDGGGLGSRACCRPCGHKESDTTERLTSRSHHLTVVRTAIVKKPASNKCWRGRGEESPPSLLVGLCAGAATMEHSVAAPQKPENEAAG